MAPGRSLGKSATTSSRFHGWDPILGELRSSKCLSNVSLHDLHDRLHDIEFPAPRELFPSRLSRRILSQPPALATRSIGIQGRQGRPMSRLKKLVLDIHRRSLWQVVVIYVGGAWACYEIIDTVTDRLALPV